MNTVERAVVGRKTPGDGKLEVSAELAQALGGDGAVIKVQGPGSEEHGNVEFFECTCTKAATTGQHVHHFVQCDAFRELPVGASLKLEASQGCLQITLG